MMRFTHPDCQFGSLTQCLILHLLNRPDNIIANYAQIICLNIEQVVEEMNMLTKENITLQ